LFALTRPFFESENGWRRALWFSVVLNVNLALINMVPFSGFWMVATSLLALLEGGQAAAQ